MTNTCQLEMPRRNDSDTASRVLVVDDHAQARESMTDILREAGYEVDCLSSAIEALERLNVAVYDVIVTDLQMPGMSGLDFIHHLQNRHHDTQVIMVTAYASVESAVDAMRHGVFDYIEKPFGADQLESLVARAVAHARAIDESPQASAAVDHTTPGVMIGSSAAMKALRAQIAQVAPTLETVLITGESGTGKELVARTLHAASTRAEQPLVSLNCPVLSAQLMESELFGHERGAFTGAEAPRTGRFELAEGGTILLDEVTEIELALQAKLLRVLQERTYERVGSSRTVSSDVRVLASTNRDLQQEVDAGNFRADLYYRLNVVPISVPPLRARLSDVPELVDCFLQRAARRLDRSPCELDDSAVELLCAYHWPGNVRELENIVSRASVLNAGRRVTADELRPWLLAPDGTDTKSNDAMPVGLSLHEMERRLIESTFEHFDGHRAKTAEALGIGIRTLSGKLRSYGVAPRAKSMANTA
ncbi:MAG: sigma-54 dependent transcriptional regulator [Pirellulales bacterium]|nr:sigma-54-dependent Fis family transcriptional regulator [Planctomycetales bacterium]